MPWWPLWGLGNIQICGPTTNSPTEWENFLNTFVTSYWQQTTYNQTDFQFTVLSNPASPDGWWPAPHSLQDYFRNCDSTGTCTQWYQQTNTPPSYAFVPDEIAYVAQSICSNPLLVLAGACNSLQTYNRLLIIQNIHTLGGQTLGNDNPFDIATGTSLGTLTMSASVVPEGPSDAEITAMVHELGHQMGDFSHYGDCSQYFTFSSFNPTIIPAGPIECLPNSWDIMGFNWGIVQLTGYSRVSRGWIDPSTTLSFDVIGGGPFSQDVDMNPLEIPPTPGNPNVIRLSIGDLSWPEFGGYYVECRESIGGDVPSPFPSVPGAEFQTVETISDEGVLITNVHEYSITDIPGAPAHHIERPLSPSDQNLTATLKPGDTFTDSELGLSVRFNGYLGFGGPRQCSVSIANLESLPPPPHRRIRFAGGVILNPSLGQLQDSISIPADVTLNNLIAPSPAVQLPIPVEPPWVGHDNLILVRVHNRSSGPIQDVQVGVSPNQPAIVTDTCGSPPASPATGASIPVIPAASSELAALDWTPGQLGSVSLDVTAIGPGTN